uniref:Uncharacterized protein n=2 Tax=Kalmanozyma brasiliensis (strain GHG001) TaxID=1365824 RepID=V5EVH0_KALBG
MARKQHRERQLARRNKDKAAKAKSAATPPSQTKQDVLPELRLLSATRTAPIGWSQFSGAAAFAPHMVEVYDERDAKCAPERQRFWPIIDHQLDYTGARMLSLSNGTFHLSEPCAKPLLDEPISPKSGLPLRQLAMPAYTQPIGSSDEDRSPVTPDAPTHRAARSPTRPSRQARKAVAKESQRKARIPLSPSATLSAVIDFTRAQASAKQHPEPARNAYGQLIHSPPSPPVKPQHSLAPHAPLRIAPRSVPRSRDYFGHWETYLCHFGKESTF